MHKCELDERERSSFERAMETVRHMPPEDQYSLIEHAVATSIRYATAREDQVLVEWAQGILATVRMCRHASDHEGAAVAEGCLADADFIDRGAER